MDTTITSKRRGDAAVLRRIWRLHFWVGLFAAPALVVLGATLLFPMFKEHHECEARARDQLGVTTFDAAWRQGNASSFDQAAALALHEEPQPTTANDGG